MQHHNLENKTQINEIAIFQIFGIKERRRKDFCERKYHANGQRIENKEKFDRPSQSSHMKHF